MKEKTFTDRQVLLRKLGYCGGGSCSGGRYCPERRSDPGKFDLMLNILTVFVLEMRRAEPTFGSGMASVQSSDQTPVSSDRNYYYAVIADDTDRRSSTFQSTGGSSGFK